MADVIVGENEIEVELEYANVKIILDKKTDKISILFDGDGIEYSVLTKLLKALKKLRNRPVIGKFDDLE